MVLSSSEIKKIKFSKAMSGFKQEEVEVFLDKIEADLAQYERIIKELQTKNEELTNENSELKESQNSIQNVLLSAQRLADRIVGEAKEKSEEIIKNAESNISVITAREKELATTFELKAQERKANLEKELGDMVSKAQRKAESITAAAENSVARQQVLFDKLKIEIAAFKASITSKYKEHLEVLSAIPDTVPQDPKQVAEAVSAIIDKQPELMSFVKNTEPEVSEDAVSSKSQGFVIDNNRIEEQMEETEE